MKNNGAKLDLYGILSVLLDIDCIKCPTYNLEVKDAKIQEAMRYILNNLVREVLPPIKEHKFNKETKREEMAHIGGYNNCRAVSIRRIREYCGGVVITKGV